MDTILELLMKTVVVGGGGAGLVKWGPAALDQIVRTVIVWRRQDDVVDLGDVTFVPPDDVDEIDDG